MNLKKITAVIICFIFMSFFCAIPVYADYPFYVDYPSLDYDLGDFEYTPAAPPNYHQYPCSALGFGNYLADLSFYLCVASYDVVADTISDSLLFDDVVDYFSDSEDDIKNPLEVFRRMMFPTSVFSSFYDPYYEDEFHAHGHPGSHGRETYIFGDGVLTFTYDFNFCGDISLAAHSSVSSQNNSSVDLQNVLCSVVFTVNYSYGGNSAFWRSAGAYHYGAPKNFHYSGQITNPTVNFSENSDYIFAQVCCDQVINFYNTDTGFTSTQNITGGSIGNALPICVKSDPNIDINEIRNTLKGVPRLYKEPDTPTQIDDAPQCILIPEPKNDVTSPSVTVPDINNNYYYYYVAPDGSFNISPDIVLNDTDSDSGTPFIAPDISFPISLDGLVNINGNNFMCMPVLNSFSPTMQNYFSVALSSFYQNLYVNMGGDPAACGCPDYSSWFSLINTRLSGIDYDLKSIYGVLVAIYNKQAKQFDLSLEGIPGVEFPPIDGEVSVAIDDLELELYRKFDYSTYFKSLRILLNYFVDGYVDVDQTNYDKLFLIEDPPDYLPESSEESSFGDGSPSESLPEAAAASASDSSFIELCSSGTASPSFTFEFMGETIDLMSWYSPEAETYMSIFRSFLGIVIVCGWLLWLVRVLPSVLGVVGFVDNGKDGG